MRLPSAYALTATLAFALPAAAQQAAEGGAQGAAAGQGAAQGPTSGGATGSTAAALVGTWSTKSNKTLTGPVCDDMMMRMMREGRLILVIRDSTIRSTKT